MKAACRFACAAIAFALTMLAACGRDEPVQSYSGGLYPGASLQFRIPSSEPLLAQTDVGEFITTPGLEHAFYVAPLENGEDRYSIGSEDGSRIIVQGSIVVDMSPPAAIEVIESDNRTQASGRYGSVEFAVLANDARTASATYAVDGRQLVVTIDGDRAEVQWDGITLDGYGELRDDEAKALREISTGPLARALTMVPLDLGCLIETYELPLSAYAALVFPWQVILKYEVADRGYVIPHFLARSGCSFTGLPDPQGLKPANGSIVWDRRYPIPTTPFLFPFDGAGQLGGGGDG